MGTANRAEPFSSLLESPLKREWLRKRDHSLLVVLYWICCQEIRITEESDPTHAEVYDLVRVQRSSNVTYVRYVWT